MSKIEIEIPVGKEVDWEASAKQKQIVLKYKQPTYEDVCEKLFVKEHYYINVDGGLCLVLQGKTKSCPNNASTKHQLECILAKNKLANVARYLNGDWDPYEDLKTIDGHFNAYVLWLTPEKDYIGCTKIKACSENSNVLFQTYEKAQQAIEILGEKTVKLALEPLY